MFLGGRLTISQGLFAETWEHCVPDIARPSQTFSDFSADTVEENTVDRDACVPCEDLRYSTAFRKNILFGGIWRQCISVCCAMSHQKKMAGLIYG